MPAGGKLEIVLSPYMEIDGITASALVSRDGLLVESAGDVADLETAAAVAAATLASAAGLARELGSGEPRLVALDLDGKGIVMAPLTAELFLLLLGGPAVLDLARQAQGV